MAFRAASAAEAWIDLAGLDRPVAVVAGDLVDAVAGDVGLARVGLEGGEPDRAHAELVEGAVGDRRR
jgi:hypothetical protein